MDDPDLPQPTEETIQRLAALHQEHHRSASVVQRFANRVTDALGQPGAVVATVALVILWIIGNYAAQRVGHAALEEFPFPELGLLATIAAVVIALLILTTQRHSDELADKRAQLTLQIALLSEKKVAKIIELLEEQRRDNPLLASRPDREAAEMAVSVDPEAAMARIQQTHVEPE